MERARPPCRVALDLEVLDAHSAGAVVPRFITMRCLFARVRLRTSSPATADAKAKSPSTPMMAMAVPTEESSPTACATGVRPSALVAVLFERAAALSQTPHVHASQRPSTQKLMLPCWWHCETSPSQAPLLHTHPAHPSSCHQPPTTNHHRECRKDATPHAKSERFVRSLCACACSEL